MSYNKKLSNTSFYLEICGSLQLIKYSVSPYVDFMLFFNLLLLQRHVDFNLLLLQRFVSYTKTDIPCTGFVHNKES